MGLAGIPPITPVVTRVRSRYNKEEIVSLSGRGGNEAAIERDSRETARERSKIQDFQDTKKMGLASPESSPAFLLVKHQRH